tara:strand:+ start:208 stop:585 length:378 start_codon:yes stop_codon:yes gene_type:complete
MNIKILFWVQGALLIVLGLWGLINGEGAIAGFGWEATSEVLTLNRAFSLSQLVLGIIAVRIPSWVETKLKEPALVGAAINIIFLINIVSDLNADAISGTGVTINLVLTIVFAILFLVFGVRYKNT